MQKLECEVDSYGCARKLGRSNHISSQPNPNFNPNEPVSYLWTPFQAICWKECAMVTSSDAEFELNFSDLSSKYICGLPI